MLEDLTNGDGIKQRKDRKEKGTDQPKVDVPPVSHSSFASLFLHNMRRRIVFNSS
jgi:hypothetical protein